MNAVVALNGGSELAPPRRNEATQVLDPIPLLDTARFEHMQRVAAVMARTTLVPDTLRGTYEGSGQGRKLVLFEPEQIMANCFLVVNQSVRWGMDPFAVAACCSVVHGRLMYEGKLVAAVLDAKLGVKLDYQFNDKQGDAFGVKVIGPPSPSGRERAVDGTVGQWKTTGANSPWSNFANHRRQLIYRGAREWARLWEPAILLGVYTPDEMDDLSDASRSVRARDVTPAVSGPPRQVRKAEQTEPSQPAKETSQVAPEQEERKAEIVGDEVNLDELVAQVVKDSELAQTEKDLDDCFDPAQPYLLSDACSREQRNRLETAWETARARIAKPAEAKKDEATRPVQQQQQPQPEREVDPNDPDYQRGRSDFGNGVHRCLNPAIKSDPARLARWGMGYGDAKAESGAA